jgi:fucose permease
MAFARSARTTVDRMPRAAAPPPDAGPGPVLTGSPRSADRARVAVAVVFAVNGVEFSSWLSRLPAVRDTLGLTPGQLGLLLLAMASGTVGSLPLSGLLVRRIGPARAVLLGGLTVTAGLLAVAVGLTAASLPPTAVGLFFTGLGTGTWDVAMNVEATDVEQRLGRTLLPRFHAGFSLGTVAGALLGAAAAATGVPLPAQLAATALCVLAVLVLATRRFLAFHHDVDAPASGGSGLRPAWREPRTLLIGVMVLSFAFTEGTANDWLAIALVDGHHATQAQGALGFSLFVAAMTLSRTIGGSLLDRWGRPRVLRATAVLALAGLLLVIVGPAPVWVAVGSLLWGAGSALGFPVGMTAAADDPASAAVRVSVVSSIGYTAFLGGPPLIGLLAGRVGILDALLVVLAALVVALLAAGAARPEAHD